MEKNKFMNIKVIFPSGYRVKDIFNDNIDINIILDNGDVYFATMFTLSNIRSLMVKESLIFFDVYDVLIVRDLRRNSIKELVKELVERNQVDIFCSKIGNENEVYGEPPQYSELKIID